MAKDKDGVELIENETKRQATKSHRKNTSKGKPGKAKAMVSPVRGKKSRYPKTTDTRTPRGKRSQPARRKAADEGTYFRTIQEVCDFFNIPRRSYVRRRSAPGYPVKRPKGYLLTEVRDFLESSGLLHTPDDTFNKDQEQAKKARIQRLREEFDLDLKKGKYISREDHERDMHGLVTVFLEGLEDLRGQIAARVRRADVTERVEKCIAATRDAMAERILADG